MEGGNDGVDLFSSCCGLFFDKKKGGLVLVLGREIGAL